MVMLWAALAVAAGAGEFAVQTCSYLGSAADAEAVRGVRILSNGQIVLAANLGTAQPGNSHTVVHLLAGATTNSGGALVRLSPDGQSVLSVTRVADSVWDLATDAADCLYVAAGSNGVLKLDSSGASLLGHWLQGVYVHRVDAGPSGRVVCLAPSVVSQADEAAGNGTVYHFAPDGALVASWPGKANTLDVCLDEASQTIITIGWRQANAWGPPGDTANFFPVQIAYLRGADYSGATRWTAYDWDARTGYNAVTDAFDENANDPIPAGTASTKYRTNFLNRYVNNMADTRGQRCALGRDGQLYAAFEAAGGNHIFRSDPFDLAVAGPIVGGDYFHQFINTGASHKTYVGRHDPASGAVLLGQQFNSVISGSGGAPSANTLRCEAGEVTADEQGRLYLVGASAWALPMWPNAYYTPGPGQETFNPFTATDYAGGAFLWVMSSNLATRLYVTRLALGTSHAVDARFLAGATQASIAFGGRADLANGPIYTKAAIQPQAGYGQTDGFFGVLGGTNGPGGDTASRFRFTYGYSNYTAGATLALRGRPPANLAPADHDGDGPDDSIQGYDFSETDPLTPPSGWTGPRLFGGFRNLTLNATNSTGFYEYHFTGSQLSIRVQPPAETPCAQHGVFFLDKADFGLDPTNKLAFDRTSRVFCNADYGRWLVRQRGVFYVSELTIAETPARTLSFVTDEDDGRWAVFPLDATLDFDAATALFVTRNFDDLDALGFVVDVDAFSADRFWMRFSVLQAELALNKPPDAPPQPAFTAAPAAGACALEVTLDASPSTDDTGVSFYTWEFGDGTRSSGPLATHLYGAAGPFEILLRAWDDQLQTATTTRRVYVTLSNTPPAVVSNVVAAFGGAVGSALFARAQTTGSHDWDGDGPDDFLREAAFDESAPLLTAKGTRWHGGLRTPALDAAPNWAEAGTSGSALGWRVQPAGPIQMHAALFVDKSQFLNRAAWRPVSFGPGSFLRLTNVTRFDALGQVRWLVRDGTNYFVSETRLSNTTAGLRLSFASASDHGRWAVFDPRQALNFDQTNAVFQTRVFTNVTGVGLLVDNDTWDASRHWLSFGGFECLAQFETDTAPPVAAFTATPLNRDAFQAVQFDGRASTCSGAILSYEWDFGDGSRASGPEATYAFTQRGAFPVTLTVTDDLGQRHSLTQVYEVVPNEPPVASFSVTPAEGEAPLEVLLDASASTDNSGIVAYDWDLDGDGVFDASGVTLNHVFASPFLYAVVLRVTDNGGKTAFATNQVRVTLGGQIPPVARFSLSATSGLAPFTVTLSAATSFDVDGVITSYEWDFGADGTPDRTGLNTTWNIVSAGTHRVRLVVTDNAGAASSVTQAVTATVAPGRLPVVYWAGDMVSANRPFRGTTAPRTVLDLDADGASDDCRVEHVFSLTQPLSPPSNVYFGLPFYGGLRSEMLNVTNYTPADFGVLNAGVNGARDLLSQRHQPGAPGRWHWVVFWAKPDFVNGGAATNARVRLAPNSLLRLGGVGHFENVGTGRWLVREGDAFFVSEAPLSVASGACTLVFTNAAEHGTWAAFDPQADLNFDQATAVFLPRTFTNLTAAGFILDKDTFSTVRHWFDAQSFELLAEVVVEPADPFAAWIAGFPTLDGDDARPEADPDGDDLPNWVEFAHGLNPTNATPRQAALGFGFGVNPGDGRLYFELSYRQRVGGTGLPGVNYTADGVTYVVQAATDLTAWEEGAAVVELAAPPVSNGDGTETVTVRLKPDTGAQPVRFVRLRLLR